MNEIKTIIKHKYFIIDNEKEILRNENEIYFYDKSLNEIINMILSYEIKDNLSFKILLEKNIKIDNEKKEIKLIRKIDKKENLYKIDLFIFNKENEFKEMKKFLKNENDYLFKLIQLDNDYKFYSNEIHNKYMKIYELKNKIKDYEKLEKEILRNENEIKNNLIKFIFN